MPTALCPFLLSSSAEMRNGMVRPDHNGRQNRQQLCFEKAINLLQIVGIQFFRQDVPYAAVVELLHDGSEDLLFHGEQPWNGVIDVMQLL